MRSSPLWGFMCGLIEKLLFLVEKKCVADHTNSGSLEAAVHCGLFPAPVDGEGSWSAVSCLTVDS